MPSKKTFIAFEILINGKRQCLAGKRDHAVLAAALTWPGTPSRSTFDCLFNVGGLVSRRGSHTHTTWIDRFDLKPGDEVSIRVVRTRRASKPSHSKTERVHSERERRREYFLRLKSEFEPDGPPSLKRRRTRRSKQAKTT